MSNVNQDMIGVRTPEGRKYPAITIGGRRYSRPTVTVRLGSEHFCVDDNTLPYDERVARIEALKGLISVPKRASKVTASDES